MLRRASRVAALTPLVAEARAVAVGAPAFGVGFEALTLGAARPLARASFR